MNSIKLDDNWRIDNSSGSATLVFEKEGDINEKTGKLTISKDVFYYSTVKQALIGYTNRCLVYSENITEVLNKLESIENLIKNMKDEDK